MIAFVGAFPDIQILTPLASKLSVTKFARKVRKKFARKFVENEMQK